MHYPGGLRRFVFPRIPEVRNRHDQGAGRNVRLGERRRGYCRRLARLTLPGAGMRLITFTVCSIGYLVEHGPRETLRFWVHSRFQHALNLSSAGGELLTLLGLRCQTLPTAIRLETPPGWDWCHQSYSRQPITLENNELRGALWRADLSRAPCWRLIRRWLVSCPSIACSEKCAAVCSCCLAGHRLDACPA